MVAILVHKVRILGFNLGKAASAKQSKSSELVVGADRIDSSTEFVILASVGIWEVRCIFHTN
jgi:protein phosphatase PTC1